MSESKPQPVLSLTGVNLRLGDSICLDSLTLSLDEGEMVAVTGRSGAGKSSLINLASGLTRASSGSIVVAGVSLEACSDTELAKVRRDHIGLVFQSNNLMPALSAAENIALALELTGLSGDVAMGQAVEAMGMVGLSGRENDRPSQLSGGERQRVAVARGLSGEKKLLLADEPTAALDEVTAEGVVRLLRDRCDRGAAVLYVTHDPGLAAWADRVVHLVDGRISGESTRGVNHLGLRGAPQ